MMGYWTIVRAKLLYHVDKTFYSFLTYDANCKYHDRLNLWASAVQREPGKR